MILCAALVLMVLLVLLDRTGKLDLTHPAGVLFTAGLFTLSAVYAAGRALIAAAEALVKEAWGLTLLGAVTLLLGASALGLYVLLKAHLCPRGVTPALRVRRLVADGLAMGLPLQVIMVGGYMAAAFLLQDTFQGPLWMLPFYPIVLALLWPMMHLVFHVALVAWMLDPLILLAAGLIGVLWTAQALFFLHGTLRSAWSVGWKAGETVLRCLLAFVPVVDLILALRLYHRLGHSVEEAKA